jgi:hypothetical protein
MPSCIWRWLYSGVLLAFWIVPKSGRVPLVL